MRVIPANKKKHLYSIYKMLDQRLRRWADVVLMLYKCFVFAGINLTNENGAYDYFFQRRGYPRGSTVSIGINPHVTQRG